MKTMLSNGIEKSRKKSSGNFRSFRKYFFHHNRLFFPESICAAQWKMEWERSIFDLSIFPQFTRRMLFCAPIKCFDVGGRWESKLCVCLFSTRANFRWVSSFPRSKNRKTVCFLLLSKLPFTHFRYSIKLIAIPLFIGEENISKQFFTLVFATGNCFPNCSTFCWWQQKVEKEIFFIFSLFCEFEIFQILCCCRRRMMNSQK